MFKTASASIVTIALTIGALGVNLHMPNSSVQNSHTTAIELTPAPSGPGTLVIDVFSAPAITAIETTPSANESTEFAASNAAFKEASEITPPTVAEEGIATQTGRYEIQTAPMELESEFQVVGATWTGATPERIDVRTSINGVWGDWYALEINESELDRKNGTEPYIAAGSNGVQLRAIGTTLPNSFELALLTGNSGTAESEITAGVAEELPAPDSHTEAAVNEAEAAAVTGENASWLDSLRADGERSTSRDGVDTQWVLPQSAVTVTEASFNTSTLTQTTSLSNSLAPKVVSRSQWGAGKATWTPKAHPLKGAVIHHTAGNNVYTAAQAPGIVRSIFQYHAVTLGWGDIGYNFLVDKYGVIYEGRSGSLTATPGQMIQGAHAANANIYSVGVSVLGSYINGVKPTAASITAIENILAWQFDMAGIDPFGKWTTTTGITTNVIAGHKDVGATACPGLIYDQLGAIRNAVEKKIAENIVSLPVITSLKHIKNYEVAQSMPAIELYDAGDFDGNGYADLIHRDANGNLWLYSGISGTKFAAKKKIGYGWAGFKTLHTGIDFDNDGHTDVIAETKDGKLMLYPGTGTGRFNGKSQIGTGWSSFKDITAVQYGPTGTPALYAISKWDTLIAYPTNGAGKFAPRIIFEQRPELTGMQSVGDWNNDGYSDAVNKDSKGYLWFFQGDETGFMEGRLIGTGWSGFKIVGAANSAKLVGKLFALRTDGAVRVYEWELR